VFFVFSGQIFYNMKFDPTFVFAITEVGKTAVYVDLQSCRQFLITFKKKEK